MFYFFFFNDTATTEIYTLSLHDALPICLASASGIYRARIPVMQPSSKTTPTLCRKMNAGAGLGAGPELMDAVDRKSTRLNSSHANISYAVFCLKKKKNYIN